MNLLTLSTDSRIFEPGSDVRERMRAYGRVFDELRIIVATRKSGATREEQIGENVFAYRASRNPLSWFRIARHLLMQGGEWVVSSQDPFELGFGGYLIARYFHLPLQLQVHTDFLSPYFAAESLKNRIRVSFAKFLLSRATRIRVVSERIKKSLLTQLPNYPITVLPIFIDTAAIRAAPITVDLRKKYPGRFIVLMASRLTREKNTSLAIEAMRILATKYPASTRVFGEAGEQSTKLQKPFLAIVGEGPELQKLKVQSEKGKVPVRFEPWTENLASYYKTADCFLITSNYEGYGRTAVEAMAAGLPVVMTDVGLAGEVVKHEESGFVVPVGDAGMLAHALARLAADASLRKKLAAGGMRAIASLPSKQEYFERYREALICRTITF